MARHAEQTYDDRSICETLNTISSANQNLYISVRVSSPNRGVHGLLWTEYRAENTLSQAGVYEHVHDMSTQNFWDIYKLS